MEGIKKLKPLIGIAIFLGVILKLVDSPYGNIIFTIGFLGYFLMKFYNLGKVQKFFWTKLHTIQAVLLVLATASVILMYFNYPYSRIAFATLLLFESIVNLRIMITTHIGNENFKNILTFIGRLLKR
jgi:hypothetical protein